MDRYSLTIYQVPLTATAAAGLTLINEHQQSIMLKVIITSTYLDWYRVSDGR